MIKDTVQLQGFPTIKPPKIKGTVEIRLHNPTTGKTEIHKGENMVTNAVSDIFASNYCGAMDYRQFLPLYSTMYGGVLCFSKQLDVSSAGAADDYFIPDNHPTDGNPVTAHAGQTSFSDQADDYTRGVPMPIVAEDGTVTFSWEWGLSAGNGTISALALTHKDVGDAGTGSTSQAFQNMKPAINGQLGIKYSKDNPVNPVMFVGADGYSYNFYVNGTTAYFTKSPFAYETTGLVANKPFTISNEETFTVTITTNVTQYYAPLWFYDKETDYLWLFYSSAAGTTINCEKIKISTKTATHINITTDVSTGPFYNGGRNSGSFTTPAGSQMPYYNGSVYLGNSTGSGTKKFYRINLSNTADQGYIDSAVGNFGGVFIPNKPHRILSGKRFVINNNVAYPTSYATPDNWTAGNYHTGVQTYAALDDKIGLASLCYYFENYGSSSNNQYYVSATKFYLGTKYNLSSAVTKTPSQSMIVTYTLTEVAPNE